MLPAPTEALGLAHLWQKSRVLVCIGSGGVGKTTIAATLALQATLQGRRVLVLTIDPAKRLADALGLSTLHHQIQKVPFDLLQQVAAAQQCILPKNAHLSAMMVEQQPAFDSIVKRYAQDPQQAERIFRNSIYQQISATLPGAHEYASMSVLYDCVNSSIYDLIVLDTPPTTNALDFLEAPRKISQTVDSKALEWLVRAYGSTSSGLRMLGLGGTLLMKGLAKLAGSVFLEQAAQFVIEFSPILQGLRTKALEISSLLTRPQTEFVIVSSPESFMLENSFSLYESLRKKNLSLSGWILNRTHPERPPLPSKEEIRLLLQTRPELQSLSEAKQTQWIEDLIKTYEEEQILAARDLKIISQIKKHSSIPLKAIPLFSKDIYGPEGLAQVGIVLST